MRAPFSFIRFFSLLLFLSFSFFLQASIPYGPKPSWQACEKHIEALYQLRMLSLHKKMWEGYSSILMMPSSPLFEQYHAGLSPFRTRYEEILNSPGNKAWSKLAYFYQFQEKIHIGKRLADFGLEQGFYNNIFTGNGKTLASEAYRRRLDEESLQRHSLLYQNMNEYEERALNVFSDLYACGCLKSRDVNYLYDHGLVELALGNTYSAFQLSLELLEKNDSLPKDRAIDFSRAECAYNLGLTYAQALNYSKAIEYFSQSLQKDPTNQDAYLERAIAYFETNQLEKALDDYNRLKSLKTLVPPKSEDNILFSQGFLLGAPQGLADGFREIPGSLWYSLRGIGQLLWTGVSDPIAVPQKMIDTTNRIVEYLKTQDVQTISEHLAPEMAELIKNWDHYDSKTRGEKSGYLLGKYGVSLLASCGSAKAVAVYQELKKTNALCLMETMASSQENHRALVALAARTAENRAAFFAKAKISKDKQGKHIEGHQNFKQDPKKSKSIWTHPNADILLKKHAGKGIPWGNTIPGTAGYKEIVDCGEIVGFHVDQKTGRKTPTTHGKIHYDKGGEAHIVPYLPQKNE